MPEGDYLIHIFVETGKNFKLDAFDNDEENQHTFNPVLKFQCVGKTYYSTPIKNALVNSDEGHYWGEHFFFEPKKVTGDFIQS